jgi:hypothetical protein
VKSSTIEALEQVADDLRTLLELLTAEPAMHSDFSKLALYESAKRLRSALAEEAQGE